MELQEEASVAELKEVVGNQQGVRPEQLRVLFAGRELQSSATLQVRSEGCWEIKDFFSILFIYRLSPPLFSSSSSSSSPPLAPSGL